MRHVLITASLLAAVLLTVTPAMAAGAPRIGVVNLQEVVSNSKPGQEAKSEMQQIVNKLKSQAKDKKQKLDVLQDQFDKADAKSKGYATLKKNLQDSQNDYQQFVMMGQQDLEQRRQELLRPIEAEMMKVINAYGKAHHYDFILSQGAGALYAASNHDITRAVIAALDADWARQQKAQAAKNSKQTPPGGGQ